MQSYHSSNPPYNKPLQALKTFLNQHGSHTDCDSFYPPLVRVHGNLQLVLRLVYKPHFRADRLPERFLSGLSCSSTTQLCPISTQLYPSCQVGIHLSFRSSSCLTWRDYNGVYTLSPLLVMHKQISNILELEEIKIGKWLLPVVVHLHGNKRQKSAR